MAQGGGAEVRVGSDGHEEYTIGRAARMLGTRSIELLKMVDAGELNVRRVEGRLLVPIAEIDRLRGPQPSS